MRPPCLVIAGTQSGVGKTTVATALMRALTRRGLCVQPFKVGPDFIDPGFHRIAAGRPSHNLDGHMLSREANLGIFERASRDADICLVEGVMGLFDGASGDSEAGSTAQMSKWLDAPVLLVVDGSAMARSAGALVLGFETFDPDVRVGGVLFNRVAGEGHYRYLSQTVSRALGYLREDSVVHVRERHLGLHMAGEVLTTERLDEWADWLEGTVPISKLLAAAGYKEAIRIGVARDPAFQFYYEDNLQALRRAGAQLVDFSPIADSSLPEEINALYLGGGYPELHAAALSANEPMRRTISERSAEGMPIYAECGGFIYLTKAIEDSAGVRHPMCGVFPTVARMQHQITAFGYTEVRVSQNTSWLEKGMQLNGHQFRYSDIDAMPTHIERVFEDGSGYAVKNTVGTYFHAHFGSCPEFAACFTGVHV